MTKEALTLLVHEMEYVLSCINEDKIPFDGDDFHEALRLGKEALAQQCVCGEPNSAGTHRTDGPCLALQPEQEPVARVVEHGATVKLEWANADAAHNAKVGNLYTTPPQRTWVGLTDEDVRQCSRDVSAGGKENCVDRFAYAIEAKLKEKNNG